MTPLPDRVAALAAAARDAPVDDGRALLAPPRDRGRADLALPCFQIAKRQGKNPVELARAAAGSIAVAPPLANVEAAGPYLNFTFEAGAIAEEVVGGAIAADAGYGSSDEGAGKTVVVDFSSPNIAKPFGIHHLRSTVIGAAIGRVLRARGYAVEGVNHLGDWGTQFGQLIVAFRRWGDERRLDGEGIPYLLELYVRFNEEKEAAPELQDEARAAFRALEAGDADCRALWARFKEVSEAEFRRVYDILGVAFEHFTGESFYEDKMPEVLAELEASGLLEQSDDATVVNLEDDGLGVSLVKKGDDSTLYVTRDLAAAIHRHRTFGFHKALYVVGAAQSLHFKQLFRILEKLGKPFAGDMVHVPFGLLRFKDGKMSTRQGKVIFLEEVLDRAVELARRIIEEKNPDLADRDRVARQVGIGAVVFNDLKSRRVKDVTFDWDEILSFEGDTGPYLQYTHARCANIFRKAGRTPGELAAEVDYGRLELEPERELIRVIGQLGDHVRRAAEEYEPSIVAQYLLSAAARFNRFYNDDRCRVVGADPATREARLALVHATQITLRNGLALLGLEAPDEM
ncbi:MAG: arginine--tRNA ligase [Planctomycetota bacterium JB042]